MVEVTQADREAAGNLADLICGCANREQHRRDVAAVLDYRATVLRSLADNPAMVERVAKNMKRQMENEDENTPSSIQRDKGLIWLEGWFDMEAVLRAVGGGE